MKLKTRKTRIQRTFGYDSLGVKLHVFKTSHTAGAARFVEDPGIIERCHKEFGLVGDPILTNNLEELHLHSRELTEKGLYINYVLMLGNSVVFVTDDIKKAKHHLKHQNA